MARILIVTQNYTIGGLETNILTFCKALNKKGHQVYLVTSTESVITPLVPFLTDFKLLDRWLPLTGSNAQYVTSQIKEFIVNNEIEYAHLHPYEGLLPASVAATACGIPYFVTIHSPLNLDPLYGAVYRLFMKECLFPNAEVIYCVSEETRGELLRFGLGGNMKVLPNPIDTQLFSPVNWRGDGDYLLISRLDENKIEGVKSALAMVSRIKEKNQDHRKFIILGDGTAKNALKDWIDNQFPNNDWIEMLGYKSDVSRYISNSSIVFGMGRVVLEAGAMNVPVVLCGYDGIKGLINTGNINEFAISNFSGRNCKSVDADTLYDQVQQLNKNVTLFQLSDSIKQTYNATSIINSYLTDIENASKRENLISDGWHERVKNVMKFSFDQNMFENNKLAIWLEYLSLKSSNDFNTSFMLSAEVFRLLEEKKQLEVKFGLEAQHFHDFKVYKEQYESSLLNEIETYKNQIQLLNKLDQQSSELKKADNFFEKIIDNQNKFSNQLKEVSNQFTTETKKLLLEKVALLQQQLNMAKDRNDLLKKQYENSLEEQIQREQSYQREISDTRKRYTDLQHEIFSATNTVAQRERELELMRQAVYLKVDELSRLKSMKLVNLLRRLKFQFINGDTKKRKAFIKWAVKKVRRDQNFDNANFNPLLELIQEIDSPVAATIVDTEHQTSLSNLPTFMSEYEARNKYYTSLLKQPFSAESLEIIKIIKGRKFKGIVVYPDAVNWEPVQRPQHLIRQLSQKGYLCFFCTGNQSELIKEVEPNLFLIKKEEYLLPVLRTYSVIVLCSWLMQMAWADLLPNKFIWYDLLDQLEFFSLYDEEMRVRHEDLVLKADLVTFSAHKLKSYVSNRTDSFYLPNGVNVDDFTQKNNETPRELNDAIERNSPIIGYYGAIEHWFDTSLVLNTAKNNPDWTFILIGHIGIDPDELKLSNIRLLGQKPYDQLPMYAKYFDVAIIPFEVNELTNCVSPVKFFEYATMGIPVVSTPIQEMKQYESNWVQLATTGKQFEESIKQLLSPEIKQIAKNMGPRFALENQWSSRISLLESRLISSKKGWTIFGNRNTANEVSVMAATFLDFEGENFYSGGAERYLIDLAEVCEKQGRNLTIYQYGNYSWVRKFKGIEVVSLSRGNTTAEVLSLETIRMFNRLFYEQVQDRSIVNIYSAFFEAWPLAANPSIGISHGVAWDSPINTYQSGTQFWEANRRFIEGAKACQNVVSVDSNTANWFQTINYDVGRNMHVIPNYVDLDEFQPRENYDLNREKTIILYPRRLYEARGLYIVLDILDKILEKYPNVDFHFVGKGFETDTRHVVQKQRRWGDRVRWYSLPPEQMPKAYFDSDISLVPTLYSEGTSLSCLEAMASGNAVISTRIGGLTDLIINNYNGYLIEPNADSLFNAIESLLLDKEKMITFKRRAVDVAKAFSKKNWMEKWTSVLQSVIPSTREPVSEKARFIEINIEDKSIINETNFGLMVQHLLCEGHFVTLRVKDLNIDRKENFGRIQWIDWNEERLSKPDVVIADRDNENVDFVFDVESFDCMFLQSNNAISFGKARD